MAKKLIMKKTNLENGKQLPPVINVLWTLIVKQEPVDVPKQVQFITVINQG